MDGKKKETQTISYVVIHSCFFLLRFNDDIHAFAAVTPRADSPTLIHSSTENHDLNYCTVLCWER